MIFWKCFYVNADILSEERRLLRISPVIWLSNRSRRSGVSSLIRRVARAPAIAATEFADKLTRQSVLIGSRMVRISKAEPNGAL